MTETQFTRAVLQNWHRQLPSLWWYKIPDNPRYMQSYSNERAVDVVACLDGVMVGMEWKLQRNERAMPIDRVRDGQITTLKAIEQAGGTGLLVVGVYMGAHNKHLYAIPIEAWELAVKTAQRKSIRLQESFPNCRVDTNRSGAYVHWDTQLLRSYTHAAKHRQS